MQDHKNDHYKPLFVSLLLKAWQSKNGTSQWRPEQKNIYKFFLLSNFVTVAHQYPSHFCFTFINSISIENSFIFQKIAPLTFTGSTTRNKLLSRLKVDLLVLINKALIISIRLTDWMKRTNVDLTLSTAYTTFNWA